MSSDAVAKRIIEVVDKSDVPVTVDYVAYNIGVSWNTAKTLLLELALIGRVQATKTSHGWIFSGAEKR